MKTFSAYWRVTHLTHGDTLEECICRFAKALFTTDPPAQKRK